MDDDQCPVDLRRGFFPFIPHTALFGGGPGSVDYSISAAWMLRATLLLGVVLFTAKLSRDPVWLVRLWWTIAIAGGSIALLGLIQKATGAGMIFWKKPATADLTTFFATYYTHGNSGAYLNLVLPVAIALALRGFLRKSSPILRAIPLALCLLLVVAAIANTSRGGQAIGALLVVALTICLRDILFSRVRRLEKKTLLVAAGVIAFALLAVAGASHLDQSLGRWHDLQSSSKTMHVGWLHARRCELWMMPGGSIRSGNFPRSIPLLYERAGAEGGGDMAFPPRGLSPDAPGMGLDRKRLLGAPVFREHWRRSAHASAAWG